MLGLLMGGSCKSKGYETYDFQEDEEDFEGAIAIIDLLQSDSPVGFWDAAENMPDDECLRLSLNYPGGTLRSLFRDSNYLHYEVAQRIGIDPICGDTVILPAKNQLVKVRSDRNLYIDELKHSYPYLVPQAKLLLEEIGQRFHDTLLARGGGEYRLKVTSLLRTRSSVKKLRRVNRASVDSSAHLFGTTFDICYTNFPYTIGTHRTAEDLKNLLAEILYELKSQERCYVIYERKQGCFHITARD